MARGIHHKGDYARVCLIPALEALKGFDGEVDRRIDRVILRARQIINASEKQEPLTSYIERKLESAA